MQCNYLGALIEQRAVGMERYDQINNKNYVPRMKINENICTAGPGYYETSDDDRSKYCCGENFPACKRYLTSLIINLSGQNKEEEIKDQDNQ